MENYPEHKIAETMKKAQDTYRYNGPVTSLTDEDRALFIPYEIDTVEDIMMIIAYSLKHNLMDELTVVHDRLMVTDIVTTYEVLMFMLALGDKEKMYYDFVPATENSKIDSKGVYRRCLGSIPFYGRGDGYKNVALNETEYYPDFGKDVVFKTGMDGRFKYKDYVTSKYTNVFNRILSV